MKTHDFRERLEFSEGITDEPLMIDALANMVPNSQDVIRATVDEDKQGTDYWIVRSHGLPPLSVDVKHRSRCPIEAWGSDDVCVETTSVYRGKSSPWEDTKREKVGWSLDYSKRTDFLAYTWPNEKGTRFWILSFPVFCRACRINWRAWVSLYGEKPAFNSNYATLCTYPTRSEVAQAMRVLTTGVA